MAIRAVVLFWWVTSAFFLSSLVHRALTMDLLHREAGWQWFDYVVPFLIAAMSDFWVSILAGVAAILTAILLKPAPRLGKGLALGLWYWVPVLSLFLHHGYVNFFHVQILPHHLAYFGDSSFLAANQTAGLDGRAWGFLLAAVLVFIGTRHVARGVATWDKRAALASVAFFAGLGILLHAGNIRWRVNFFVPENLQTHTFEKLYLNVKGLSVPAPLSEEEKGYLLTRLAARTGRLNDVIAAEPGANVPSGQLAGLRTQFDQRRRTGKVPSVVILMLESARPGDTGIYAPGSPRSDITPNISGLLKTGVWFPRAYHTGSVTRAGQEAVLCGVPSAVGASLMRERQDLQVDCLTQTLANQTETFWFHGGDGAFDGQEAFWRRQKVAHLLARASFHPDIAANQWGVSDWQLLRRSTQELQRLRAETKKSALFGMILTITNHIPWTLPTDAPAHIRAMRVEHPSFATTAYVDWALGRWVAQLKEHGLWEDMILVLASDHGARHPLYHTLYTKHVRENSVAHAVLGLTGGVVEGFTKSKGVVISHEVSQMDIAGWIASLFGAKAAPTAFAHLDQLRPRPVAVDLENRIYFPGANFVVKKSDAFSTSKQLLDDNHRVAVLYYRAIMNWLDHQSAAYPQ